MVDGWGMGIRNDAGGMSCLRGAVLKYLLTLQCMQVRGSVVRRPVIYIRTGRVTRDPTMRQWWGHLWGPRDAPALGRLESCPIDYRSKPLIQTCKLGTEPCSVRERNGVFFCPICASSRCPGTARQWNLVQECFSLSYPVLSEYCR